MTSLVSVIIPTHNRRDRLEQCIKSVQAQTYGEVEIIVVNDASTDNTQEFLDGLDHSRLIDVENRVNQGPCGSRNIGAAKASGDVLAFLDDDDRWHPSKLEKQMAVMNRGEAGLVYCGYSAVDDDNRLLGTTGCSKRGMLYDDMIRHNIFGSPTPIMRREAFEMAGGWDVSFPAAQDYDLWTRLSRVARFDFVNEPLATYVVHGGERIWNDKAKVIMGREMYFRKFRAYIMSDPAAAVEHLNWLAANHLLNGNGPEAGRYYAEAWKIRKNPKFKVLGLVARLKGARA